MKVATKKKDLNIDISQNPSGLLRFCETREILYNFSKVNNKIMVEERFPEEKILTVSAGDCVESRGLGLGDDPIESLLTRTPRNAEAVADLRPVSAGDKHNFCRELYGTALIRKK